MAVASNMMHPIIPTESTTTMNNNNNKVVTTTTTSDEIRDLEVFIDEMCDHEDMKTIQLYDRMSLELKAEVSFLR